MSEALTDEDIAWAKEHNLDVIADYWHEVRRQRERIAELEKGLRHIREAIEANEVGSKTALGIVVVSTVDALLPRGEE